LGVESTPTGVEIDGFDVSIGIFPIGIDLENVIARRLSKNVSDKINSIRELYAGKRIIIGRDKLDHTKGIIS
jgi:trehalose-6-phosphate synthase